MLNLCSHIQYTYDDDTEIQKDFFVIWLQLCYRLLYVAFCNILKIWSGGLHRGEPVRTLVKCPQWSSLLSVIRNAKSVAGLLGLFCNLLVPVAVISVLMPFGTNTVGPVRWKLKWNEITDWAVKGLFFMTTTIQLCPKKWMVSCDLKLLFFLKLLPVNSNPDDFLYAHAAFFLISFIT